MRHAATTVTLLLLLPVDGFTLLPKVTTYRAASPWPPPLAPRAASPRLAADDEAATAMTDRPGRRRVPHVRQEGGDGELEYGEPSEPNEPGGPGGPGELRHHFARNLAHVVSRRSLLHGALWTTGMSYGSGGPPISCASAYTIKRVEPEETKIYAEAQRGRGSLRVLWVGAGDLKGVSKSLFRAGTEVVALDLSRPDATDLNAATAYATAHGYRLQFEQGDATKLKFVDETFDVVVCSMFLCQDFDPAVVVSEIRRVLKPGGRFGFYEHVEDINKVIVDKVFGERAVVQVQHYPEMTNIMAGVVRKV